MHEWERIRSLPSKDKLEKAWRILEEEVWSENESVWEMNNHRHIEKDRRNERRIAKEKYINPSVMLDSWGIEEAIEVGIEDLVVDSWGIEKQRIRFKNRSSIDPPSVEELSRRQEFSRSIHQVSRRCRDCVKKNAWEARQIAWYRGGVEEVSSQFFKTVFRDVKNTDMNEIQHTTQPMIQSTQKSLKIVSQFKNF